MFSIYTDKYKKYITSLLRYSYSEKSTLTLTYQLLKNRTEHLKRTFVFKLEKDKYNIFVQYDDHLKMQIVNKKENKFTCKLEGNAEVIEYLKENLTEKEYLEFERATYDKI